MMKIFGIMLAVMLMASCEHYVAREHTCKAWNNIYIPKSVDVVIKANMKKDDLLKQDYKRLNQDIDNNNYAREQLDCFVFYAIR